MTKNKLWNISTFAGSSLNLNEITTNGVTYFENSSNTPAGEISGICYTIRYSSAFVLQFAVSDGKNFIRSKTTDTWLAWKEL